MKKFWWHGVSEVGPISIFQVIAIIVIVSLMSVWGIFNVHNIFGVGYTPVCRWLVVIMLRGSFFLNICQYNVNQLHKGGTWYIVYDKYTQGNKIKSWHRRSNILSYTAVFCVWKGYVWEMCENSAITRLQTFH